MPNPLPLPLSRYPQGHPRRERQQSCSHGRDGRGEPSVDSNSRSQCLELEAFDTDCAAAPCPATAELVRCMHGGSATSHLTVSSRRACGSQSSALRRFSPTTPPISPACCTTGCPACRTGPAISPRSWGRLSPRRARCPRRRRSASGNRRCAPAARRTWLITPGTSSISLLMVLTSVTCSFTSCARSLSPVATMQRTPSCAACCASVPITSSASTPSTISRFQPDAAMASCSGSIWRARSSGIGGRCALYSEYQSSRKVFPFASNTHRL